MHWILHETVYQYVNSKQCVLSKTFIKKIQGNGMGDRKSLSNIYYRRFQWNNDSRQKKFVERVKNSIKDPNLLSR